MLADGLRSTFQDLRSINSDLDIAHARGHARLFNRDLSRSIHRAQARRLAYIIARSFVTTAHLDVALRSTSLTVVGVDLTDLDVAVTDIGALVGVVWSEAMRWPSGLEAVIQSSSRDLGSGLFQVSDGTEPNQPEEVRL